MTKNKAKQHIELFPIPDELMFSDVEIASAKEAILAMPKWTIEGLAELDRLESEWEASGKPLYIGYLDIDDAFANELAAMFCGAIAMATKAVMNTGQAANLICVEEFWLWVRREVKANYILAHDSFVSEWRRILLETVACHLLYVACLDWMIEQEINGETSSEDEFVNSWSANLYRLNAMTISPLQIYNGEEELKKIMNELCPRSDH